MVSNSSSNSTAPPPPITTTPNETLGSSKRTREREWIKTHTVELKLHTHEYYTHTHTKLVVLSESTHQTYNKVHITILHMGRSCAMNFNINNERNTKKRKQTKAKYENIERVTITQTLNSTAHRAQRNTTQRKRQVKAVIATTAVQMKKVKMKKRNRATS